MGGATCASWINKCFPMPFPRMGEGRDNIGVGERTNPYPPAFYPPAP